MKFNFSVFITLSIGMFQLIHFSDCHGQSNETFADIRQESNFVRLLENVEINGLTVSGYELDLNMDVERVARLLTSRIKHFVPLHFVHNDLPVRMVHWKEGDRSFLLIFAQVGDNHTKVVQSTLDFNHINPSLIASKDSDTPFRKKDITKNAFQRSLQLFNRRGLFTYVDRHSMTGYVDLASMNETSRMFRQILNSQAWVPISETPNNLVMTKNGESIEIVHHESPTQTLSIVFSK